MDSQPKEYTRRDFLRRTALASGALLLPGWLASACNFGAKTSSVPAIGVSNKEKAVCQI